MNDSFKSVLGCFTIIGVIFTILGAIVAIVALFKPTAITVVLQDILPEPTPVIVVVPSPTPAKQLGPTNTPRPSLTPIHTPIPTETPIPTSTPTLTPTPTNTAIPTFTPTSTLMPTNTAFGSVLRMGETWYQDGISLTFENWNKRELTFAIRNNTDGLLYTQLEKDRFRLVNENGESLIPYWHVLSGFGQEGNVLYNTELMPGETYTLKAIFSGEPNLGVWTHFIVLVEEASRVRNARWRVDIPH